MTSTHRPGLVPPASLPHFRVVGQPVARVDAVEKVTGRAAFAVDLVVPGMLHGKVLRSVHPHARIRAIDARPALELPGVVCVLTGDGLADIDPFFGNSRDRPVVAIQEVRHVGEPVAAVAAVDELTAFEALELIEVEYEELPPVQDVHAALADGAPLVQEGHSGGNVCTHAVYEQGDVSLGLEQADEVFEDVFTFPMVFHYTMEPFTTVAQMDERGITVWSSTQHAFKVREDLARMFHESLDRVRVIVPYVGGGYGGKSSAKLEPLAVALARKAGRPVRIACSIAEGMVTNRRHSAHITLKTGVKRDGTLVARLGRVLLDTGAYSDNGPYVVQRASQRVVGPYRWPHVRIDAYAVFTNTTPAGSFRSVGGPQTAWASESQIDMIAHRLGLDPLEMRLRNAVHRGELALKHARPMDNDLAEGLGLAARAIGWAERAGGQLAASTTGGTNRPSGLGLAFAATEGGTNPTTVALIRLFSDGTASVYAGSTEMGQGVRTVVAQIAAEELRMDMEHISVVSSDTGMTPFDPSTGGSRSTTYMGRAVQLAAQDLRRQLVEIAAEALEADEAAILLEDGAAHAGSGPSLGYPELVRAFFGGSAGELVGRGYLRPSLPGLARQGQSAFWETAWGAAEVEVDEATGALKLRRYVSVADTGHTINPRMAEGQDEGAATQGLGHALFEAMAYEEGQLLNGSPATYRLPLATDIPEEFETILLESGGGTGPYGAKGIGEGAINPIAPAIANALFAATGARITDLPLTPERVWRALHRG